MLPQVYSGARCVVSINGTPIAAGFVADYTIETRATEIETVDSVIPGELAPERIRVAMNLRVYRTPDNDPILSGYAPGSASLGQTEQKAFSQSKYLYIEIKDTNDRTVMHIPKAWLVRRSGQLQMGDLMTESWSIIGMQYLGPTT
jgi:hypothetical protein